MSKPSLLTAAEYQAKYLKGGNANSNRLFRWLRMLRKEIRQNDPR